MLAIIGGVYYLGSKGRMYHPLSMQTSGEKGPRNSVAPTPSSTDIHELTEKFLAGFHDVERLSKLGSKDINNSDDVLYFIAKFREDPVFVAFPTKIREDKIPVVIYSHGQLEYLTHINEKYANKLISWGRKFAEHGYVLLAPEFYGDNWGDQKSQELLYTYSQYLSQQPFVDLNKSYYLGFSMGGRLIYNYLLSGKYKDVRFPKAVVLAGSIWPEYIPKVKCENLSNLTLVIYHGSKDVNVPVSMSQGLYELCKDTAPNIHFKIIERFDHWHLGYTDDWSILTGTY